MLVALRVTIGWHFLYEGVWKITHADEFSARPFLTQAKGPAAELFYAMVPDLDGRQRLPIETGEDGDPAISGQVYLDAWEDLKQKVVAAYELDEDQTEAVDELYERYAESVGQYLRENRAEILGYFDALDQFEREKAAGNNGADFQKERTWDRQQALRGEVKAWLDDLDQMGEAYRLALWDLLREDQKAVGMVPAPVLGPERLPVSVPIVDSRSQGLDLAVTYGLTAIGACLMVGLFTRLANLAGAAFLISVLLTQPPWPTVFPHAPPVVGHALGVDKNFVEMMAMLMLATTAVGRWGGLDFFIHRCCVKPFCRRGGKADNQEGRIA